MRILVLQEGEQFIALVKKGRMFSGSVRVSLTHCVLCGAKIWLSAFFALNAAQCCLVHGTFIALSQPHDRSKIIIQFNSSPHACLAGLPTISASGGVPKLFDPVGTFDILRRNGEHHPKMAVAGSGAQHKMVATLCKRTAVGE